MATGAVVRLGNHLVYHLCKDSRWPALKGTRMDGTQWKVGAELRAARGGPCGTPPVHSVTPLGFASYSSEHPLQAVASSRQLACQRLTLGLRVPSRFLPWGFPVAQEPTYQSLMLSCNTLQVNHWSRGDRVTGSAPPLYSPPLGRWS